MITVEFVCEKDPLLAEHYQQRFGEEFVRELSPQILDDMRRGHHDQNSIFTRRMLEEARTQEHYDFVIDARGQRAPIYCDGIPKLLIPELKVNP
jgi:hypothetical protein